MRLTLSVCIFNSSVVRPAVCDLRLCSHAGCGSILCRAINPGWRRSTRVPSAAASPPGSTLAAALCWRGTESIRKRSTVEPAPVAPACRVSASTRMSLFPAETALGSNDCADMLEGRLSRSSAWSPCRTGDCVTGLRPPGVMEPLTRFSSRWSLLRSSVP